MEASDPFPATLLRKWTGSGRLGLFLGLVYLIARLAVRWVALQMWEDRPRGGMGALVKDPRGLLPGFEGFAAFLRFVCPHAHPQEACSWMESRLCKLD